jgi:AcrR family transcriptional regulator
MPQIKPKISFGHHNRTWSVNAVMGSNAAILLRDFNNFDALAPSTMTVTFSKRFKWRLYMAKAFSKQEREIINEKLITACEECWNQYGYQKTSIRDLCSKAGISSGAFYLFYESKELLFIETADRGIKRITALIDQNMPSEKPAKQDFAKAFKIMAKEIAKSKWLVSFYKDLEIFQRKVPPEIYKKFANIYTWQAEKYSFRPSVPHTVATVALGILLMLRINPNISSKDYNKAYELLVDSAIDRLFE